MSDARLAIALPFTLSEAARAHLQHVLPAGTRGTSKLVTTLSYTPAVEKRHENGAMLWSCKGPIFLVGARNSENLEKGALYDLLGFPVWISDFEILMLEGRTLTYKKCGPEPQMELLVIENGPENLFKDALLKQFEREKTAKQGRQ